MKKLNRKGFTLIELLAVIVIMAIILVVTLPYILDSVGNAKVSSIHNLSKSAAKSYTDMAATDMIATDKKLSSDKINMTVTTDWQCMTDELVTTLGISTTDVVLASDDDAVEYADGDVTANTCSAIKLNNNGIVILLVAKDGGKFAESGSVVYALSSDSNGHKE